MGWSVDPPLGAISAAGASFDTFCFYLLPPSVSFLLYCHTSNQESDRRVIFFLQILPFLELPLVLLDESIAADLPGPHFVFVNRLPNLDPPSTAVSLISSFSNAFMNVCLSLGMCWPLVLQASRDSNSPDSVPHGYQLPW